MRQVQGAWMIILLLLSMHGMSYEYMYLICMPTYTHLHARCITTSTTR